MTLRSDPATSSGFSMQSRRSQAFIKAIQVADVTGLYLIIVDAKETSTGFYEHYGFQKFEDEDLSYYMLVDTVRKALQG